MPQLDFTWWMLHLIITWTFWATIFLALTLWTNNANLLKKNN
uniref:ATPase subunit 8 n=1 Tax=Amphipholis squamata TaxID=48271 RepID=D3H5V5_AMPSQ|nr:ATPase subunit 8 [Amphipholis squamata]